MSSDHADVVFETASCQQEVQGTADLRTLLRTMSALYSSFAFTRELACADRTYLQWTGRAFDMDVAGLTVIEWDDEGRIAGVDLHLRPLVAVRAFAIALAARDVPGSYGTL